MVDLMLEASKRRDYRLVFVWGCKECGGEVTTFIHRTKEEFEAGKRNIRQKCWNFKHVTTPDKECNKCKLVYTDNDFTCTFCEPEIKRITELELSIEDMSRVITRAEVEFKKKKLSEEDLNEVLFTTYDLLTKTCEQLDELRAARNAK